MRRRKWMTVLGIGASLCALAGVMGYAYWKLTGSTGNLLTMASYRNEIVEEYQVPQQVTPGQTVDKVVQVANTGTVDSLIRVKIRKAFGDKAADGSFTEDTSLDPEMIRITCDDEHWMLRDDGYYYYRAVLKAGTQTEAPLFRQYTFSKEAGNAYRGKEARIYVTMESVQAQDDAPQIWGITYQDLGIQRPAEPAAQPTEVVYLGQKGGFDVSESRTDLFASFKNLTPGCARTQKITVKNRASEEIGLYLRAEAAGQKQMDAATAKLVSQLLNQAAQIEITGSSGRLYKGPVSGNLSGSGSSMKEDIYLGTYAAGSSRELTVKLSLDEEMDNVFCDLTGKVRWVFTAKGEDGSSTVSSTVPSTGDTTDVGMWMALLGGSVILMAGAGYLVIREDRKEQHESDKRNS